MLSCLSMEEYKIMRESELYGLQLIEQIRNFILHSNDFPFQVAWDLNTRKVHFYLNRFQVEQAKMPQFLELENETYE